MSFNIKPINPSIMELSVAGAVRYSPDKENNIPLNNDDYENNHLKHDISFPLKENIEIEGCTIGEQYFLTFINGNSMFNSNISSGDILLWDSCVDVYKLDKDDILLIRMRDTAKNKPGMLKLRLFDKVEGNKVYTNKYVENDIQPSGNWHSIESILGTKKEIIDRSNDAYNNIINNSLEICNISTEEQKNNTYFAKILNVDIFLETIYDFTRLNEHDKNIAKKYITDILCIRRDGKEEAEDALMVKIKDGLTVFNHLLTNNEHIDSLASIYFKFLLSVNNALKLRYNDS